MLAPPLEADDKFTGAHISGLVAAHIATVSPMPLGGLGPMQSVGSGLQCFNKRAI